MKKLETEKKKRLLISLIVIFGTIIVIAVSVILIKLIVNNMSARDSKQLQESYAENLHQESYAPGLPKGTGEGGSASLPGEESGSSDPGSEKPVKNEVKFDELIERNSDAYSWIYIPNTNISLPVMQSAEDDNFYLEHDIDKNYKFAGCIYSQSKNKKDYSDRVTVLYGHNMADGSMFANLHYYMDEEFFDTHRYIYIYTPDRRLTYEVVSAYEYDNRHILNSFDFTDDAVFSDWLEEAKNPHSVYSKVRDDVKLDLKSKMLVLSTCMPSGDNRFIVQGVLIKDEKTE